MNFSTDLAALLPSDRPTLSYRDIAHALGVSPFVVRTMVEGGLLPRPAVLNARVHLFRTEQVREALARLAAKGGEA